MLCLKIETRVLMAKTLKTFDNRVIRKGMKVYSLYSAVTEDVVRDVCMFSEMVSLEPREGSKRSISVIPELLCKSQLNALKEKLSMTTSSTKNVRAMLDKHLKELQEITDLLIDHINSGKK